MMKINIIFVFFIICFLTIIGKLFIIQLINPKSSGLNYLQANKINPERGKIYDKNKNPLVLNQNNYLLYAEPKKIKNKGELVKKLDEILKIGESTIEAKIDNSKYWVAIKSGIDEEEKEKIRNLNLDGIGLEYGTKRFYPEASLSSHLIGFLGKNEKGEDIGYFGLEGFYDKDLQGLSGFFKSERDLLGKLIFIGTQEKVAAENGRDLVLTIDKTVQEIIKRKLTSSLERYQAKAGCVIVADPQNMRILGLACLPDYDPDNYFKFSEEYFKNSAISDLYEPGSIFKPLIMAAAIEEKKIKPDDIYDEQGPIEIGDYKIKTWDDKYEGKITMTRILEKSSNVGMVYIGGKIGEKTFYNYLKKYGFGELTGIDLQGEISGYLKNFNNWYPIDFATVTFGQGIAISPIQMLRAFASVINGGKLFKPMIVGKIINQENEKEIKPKLANRVLSEYTSDVVRKMLVSTVENGEFKWAVPKGYSIGGKTGTAQIPIKGHYDPTKTIASFVGFAPAEKPKFIALVVLREPQASQWGSETAAPLFFEIAKELLIYYNIAPE